MQDITIKDVAKQASVSVSTVSRVINGLDRVSVKTRKKVLKVIEDLNYVPNSLAVSMITKKTKMLGIVVPEIQNPFYTAVIQGTVEVAKKHGFYAFVFSTNDCEEEEREFFEGMLSKHIEGVVLIGAHKSPEFYRSLQKKVVLVDRYIEDTELDGVVINNFKGAYDATHHLIECGHQRISMIIGPRDFNDGRERHWGFMQAMKDKNLEIEESYLKEGNWFEENGYRSTVELLDLPIPPTAIFAGNNLICQGAIKALRDRGMTMGEDISLVGFDDNVIAEFTKPKVTVVRRPTAEMGRHAGQMLIDKIGGVKHENMQPKKVTLNVELVVRGSVRNLI